MDIKTNKINLFKNTFFLYLLTFSNQLINLVAIPYQTRVLGVVNYGKIGVAVSIMAYVQIVLDFGFILSGTAEVAENNKSKLRISEIMTSIITIRVAISIVVAILLSGICYNVSSFREDFKLIILYFIAYLINSFLPDFIYRGIEQMKSITIRTLIVRSLFLCLMFLVIKKAEDYVYIPIILLVGNIIAVVISYIDIYVRWNYKLVKVSRKDIWLRFKKTIPFFISRFASSFYQALNLIILGIYFPGSSIVGCYSAADKIVNLAKSCSSPIADSMYPYMIKNKDYKLIKKILTLVMPIIFLGSIVLFIFSESIGVFIFGDEYKGIGSIIKIMVPILVVIFPTYILAFPVMVPMGLAKFANISNVIGAIVQIALLSLLIAMNMVNVITLAVVSCVSEMSVFVFRTGVVFKYRNMHNAMIEGEI